jgi:hypothetical protein
MIGRMNPLPPAARWLGLAGLLPFLATLLVALFGPLETVGLALFALASYGAVILSFLGAVHWGFAMYAPPDQAPAAGTRLALGVLPALIAWVALLLPPGWGLGLLGFGILATASIETRAARQGLVPLDYLRLRWILSSGAAACLLVAAALFGT